MPIIKIIATGSSSNLDKYLEREKEGSGLPRVAAQWAQHCRPETAGADFRALREEHDQQGAMRKLPATYVRPEDAADATHIRIGKNWRAVRAGETATHQRIEPAQAEVKRAEAHHVVVSFGADEVNVEDATQTQRAFDAVVEHMQEQYPGLQMKLVAHTDAKGSKDAAERGEAGKFHVHAMINAVVYEDMEIDGRTLRAGRRSSPAMNIDRIRERHDAFLEARGHEFGLGPQKLPAPRSAEARAVRSTAMDFHSAERGEISAADRARRGVETALERLSEDPARLQGATESQRLQILADEVAATGDAQLTLYRAQRGARAGETRLRSYLPAESKQPIRGQRLGERYTEAGLQEQLEAVAAGRWQPLQRHRAGEPRPLTELPTEELEAVLEAPGQQPQQTVAPRVSVTQPAAAQQAPVQQQTIPATTKPAGPHKVRGVDGFEGMSTEGVELLAVVQETPDGLVYADFQVNAEAAQGQGQRGLHLWAKESTRKNSDGSERKVTVVSRQLTAAQYDRIKHAAGDNVVAVDDGRGAQRLVYSFAADVESVAGRPRAGQFQPRLNTAQSSSLQKPTDRVLAQQRAAESEARQAVAEGRLGDVSQSTRKAEQNRKLWQATSDKGRGGREHEGR